MSWHMPMYLLNSAPLSAQLRRHAEARCSPRVIPPRCLRRGHPALLKSTIRWPFGDCRQLALHFPSVLGPSRLHLIINNPKVARGHHEDLRNLRCAILFCILRLSFKSVIDVQSSSGDPADVPSFEEEAPEACCDIAVRCRYGLTVDWLREFRLPPLMTAVSVLCRVEGRPWVLDRPVCF